MTFSRTRMLVLVFCLWTGIAYADGVAVTFTLRDDLQRNWERELVFFPVEQGVFGGKHLTLIGPEGKAIPYQWVPAQHTPSGEDSIAFLASVPEFGQSTYRLVEGEPLRETDLKVEETQDIVRVTNRFTGIAVDRRKALLAGPIAGVRLPSGRWVGGGELTSPLKPEGCTVKVAANGPVFADVLVSYHLPEGNYWRSRFRIISAEPVILVDEEFHLPEGSFYTLKLGKGWDPDRMFYRDYSVCKTARISDTKGDRLFLMMAWVWWWGWKPCGNWTSFYRSDGDDLLAIGCREPGVWMDPGRTKWRTSVDIKKAGIGAVFQLRGFARKWMLAALPKTQSVTDRKLFAPLPQQYLIKYSDVPLDLIKDYVTEWDDSGTQHPRLFVTKQELERFRQTFKVNKDRLEQLRKTDLTVQKMDEAIAYFLATGDVALGRRIAEMALRRLQNAVDIYVRQDSYPTQGSDLPRHYNNTTFAVNACDAALAPGVLSAEERRRMKAQLAYLGYTLASPTVCSPERGYAANPNMTTSIRGVLGIVACTIPDHPRAAEWAQMAIREMKHELDHWSGPGGGWLEAPHYMTVSMDAIIPLAVALRRTSFTDTDWACYPRLKKTVEWLAKISTPPDPRLGGDRHMPAVGNTYTGERTCLPGWMARICREEDPEYARSMQWMWRAHGCPTTPGIGGAYPGVRGYSFIMLDESIPAEPPKWASEHFPEAGAVFRAHFPGDRETYMHYIQGKMHQHYDYDEGSFILWGKGQPLCEDFGYYGRAAAADHSRVDDGVHEYLGNEGHIREFCAGDGADYLHGERSGWHRQILFVKDADPLGPNYFLVRDTVASGRKADWRVWIATDEAPAVTDNPVRAVGRFEADLVVFFAEPARPDISTEELTRTSGASGFKSRQSTQRCLHVKMPPRQPVAAVLYPVMKDQQMPQFTSLLGGRVVKIESPFGTDYAFLALESFRFSGDGIDFEGKAGAVQIRPDGVRLSLPWKGKVSYRGRSVQNPGGEAQTVSEWFSK